MSARFNGVVCLPFTPVRRLDLKAPMGLSVYPATKYAAARKHKRVFTGIAYHRQFEITVEWRA